MSNASLKRRIEAALDRFERREMGAAELAEAISLHGGALEGVSPDLAADRSMIAHRIETFYDEEGRNYDLEDALRELRAWLSRIPLNV